MIRKINLLIICSLLNSANSKSLKRNSTRNAEQLNDHLAKSDTQVYPYVVAVLKKSSFLCSGALISDIWVLTGADPLYTIRETHRIIRIRLGSSNYKRGGILLPIKYFEIHPFFDDKTPEFDVALIRMPGPVRLTYNVNPIRIEKRKKELAVTHLLVTFWSVMADNELDSSKYLQSEVEINHRRILQVSHLHPTNVKICAKYLKTLKVNDTSNILCLEPNPDADPCQREAGVPVVHNRVLLGIISSWTPEDCEAGRKSPEIVNLVSSKDISSWIRATTEEVPWRRKNNSVVELEEYYDVSNI